MLVMNYFAAAGYFFKEHHYVKCTIYEVNAIVLTILFHNCLGSNKIQISHTFHSKRLIVYIRCELIIGTIDKGHHEVQLVPFGIDTCM